MTTKEHFNAMLVTLGWAVTGSVVVIFMKLVIQFLTILGLTGEY